MRFFSVIPEEILLSVSLFERLSEKVIPLMSSKTEKGALLFSLKNKLLLMTLLLGTADRSASLPAAK